METLDFNFKIRLEKKWFTRELSLLQLRSKILSQLEYTQIFEQNNELLKEFISKSSNQNEGGPSSNWPELRKVLVSLLLERGYTRLQFNEDWFFHPQMPEKYQDG